MKLKLNNKNVAVLGLGVEGKDIVKFLLKQKANVSVYDRKEKDDLDLTNIDTKRIKLYTGIDYLKNGFPGYDVIFRSPGVYRYLPELVEAERGGAVITSATKIFFELCKGKIIGVTGTKGKGTTSTLIYKILKNSGIDTYLAGNIGISPIALLEKVNKDTFVVMELSSFQLIDLFKSPHIAVVLNITTDHLDWHKNYTEYRKSKMNIVKFQNKNDIAVINADYPSTRNFTKITKSRLYHFSKNKKVEGAYALNGKLVLSCEEIEILGSLDELKIIGEHNWENVTAAVCASYLAGAKKKQIKKTVFGFRGLEHRLELVSRVSGVSFYNDSFSTNPQTTIAAIKSFTEPITLILGGSDKNLDYSELARTIALYKNVETVVLIGVIAQRLEMALKKVRYSGKTVFYRTDNFKNIAKFCLGHAKKGGVVLLSPATASFDMFSNYKQRGKSFKKSVKLLLENK